MDKVSNPSTTFASMESKSYFVSMEYFFTNESSSVFPSMVNVSESTDSLFNKNVYTIYCTKNIPNYNRVIKSDNLSIFKYLV